MSPDLILGNPAPALGSAEDEPRPPPTPAKAQAPGIRYHDRIFVAGSSDSGKSEIVNYLFSQFRNQRLLMDTKPEFVIPGVRMSYGPEQVDWDQPIIHYRPASGEPEEYDEIFYEAYQRRNLLVACHELGDLCEDNPGRATRWTRRYIRGGNIRGNGLLGASQRPVGVPKQARTEALHVIQVVPGLDPEDHDAVARMMRLHRRQLDQVLEEAAALSPNGKYSCVWYDRNAGSLVIRPPLPDELRRQIIVRRQYDL